MTKMISRTEVVLLLVVLLICATLVACGGGGSSTSASDGTTTPSEITISGVVSKGPVSGATVTAFEIVNGAKGHMLGNATTNQDGSWTMNIGQYDGPILMEAAGGLYADEATGKTLQMGNMMFRAATNNITGNAAVAITPLTEMAVEYMNGNYAVQMMATANQLMNQTFGVSDIVSTMPHNVSTPAQPGHSNETYYGLMLAAMSQMAASSNSTVAFVMQEMVNSMKANNTQQVNSMLSMMNQAFTTFNMGPQNMTGTTPSPAGMMGSGGMMGGNTGNTPGPTGAPGMGGGMM